MLSMMKLIDPFHCGTLAMMQWMTTVFSAKAEEMDAPATLAKALPIHEEDHQLLRRLVVAGCAAAHSAANVCVAAAAKILILSREKKNCWLTLKGCWVGLVVVAAGERFLLQAMQPVPAASWEAVAAFSCSNCSKDASNSFSSTFKIIIIVTSKLLSWRSQRAMSWYVLAY